MLAATLKPPSTHPGCPRGGGRSVTRNLQNNGPAPDGLPAAGRVLLVLVTALGQRRSYQDHPFLSSPDIGVIHAQFSCRAHRKP